MKAKRSKSFIVGCWVSLVLCLVAGAATITWFQKTNGCFKERLPLRGFDLTINRSQQRQLIKELQKFAEKHEFKFDIAYFSRSGEDFRVDMIRKDVQLIVWNTIIDLDQFDANFYNYDCVHPTVAADIEDLATEFKNTLSQIPSVVIIEDH
jgi:hypothetical protein